MSDERVRAVLASIGANVRGLRMRRGLTQEALAEKCALEPRTVQAVERGRTNLSIAVLVSIASALDVDCRVLMRPGELQPPRAGRPPKSALTSGGRGEPVLHSSASNPKTKRVRKR